MKKIQVELNEAQVRMLESLIPGFGNNVGEVAQFAIIKWMSELLGIDGMKASKP